MIDAYFVAVNAAFQQALQSTTEQTRVFDLHGGCISLHFAGDALASKILPALAHHPLATYRDPDLTILIWDSASTGIELPHRPWIRKDGAADVSDIDSDRFFVTDQQERYYGVDILHLYDAQERLAIFHVPDAERLPYWIESFPLRILFHTWTLAGTYQLVHAGAVGLPDGGVLLAGRGGSGKSTSVLACLDSDLKYVGDDYVIVNLADPPEVYSLYNTAKLEDTSLEMLPDLKAVVSNPDRRDDEKALIYLHQHQPEKLISGFPLKAILIPEITGQLSTEIVPSSPVKALTEIAPTTIFQLQKARDVTMRKLKALTRSVPIYILAVGTDLSQIPSTILKLLEQEIATS